MHGVRYQQLHRYALAFGLARDLDVLDVASGEGFGAAYLALVARSVVGVDGDPHAVRHAAARYTAMNLTFRTGPCTNVPLADRSVDLAVSFETLEHVDEREQFLREIVRVLRPDGKLIVSAPNKLFLGGGGAANGYAGALYFDELRDLLRNAFPHCRIYGQRIIAASAVHPLRGHAEQARCISPAGYDGEQGLPALPVPASFVAVCARTDAGASFAELDSVFVDPRDDLLQQLAGGQHMLAPPADAARLEREPAAYLPAPAADANGDLLRRVLVAAFGHEDALPPDLAEAAAQAETLVRDAFEERERTAVRAAELQVEVADQYARLEEAERRAERLAGETDALRAEAARAAERIAELTAQHAAHTELERERDAAVGDAERLRRELEALDAGLAGADAERQALVAEIARLQAAGELERARSSDAESAGDERAAAFEQQNDELRRQLNGALRERDEARAELARIVESNSWRITKPLRVAMRPFRHS